MVKPEHLIPAEGEELLEEHAKELKEWEAQYKAFIADQEAYARSVVESRCVSVCVRLLSLEPKIRRDSGEE